MTTNKPEVEAVLITDKNEGKMRGVSLIEHHDPNCTNENWQYVSLIRLSDYEALQAELETVKKVAYGNIELLERNEALQAECEKLVEALEEGLRAIGDHHAPDDCYATGPMTGDPFRDLVQCPACSFIAMCDGALAAHRKGGEA